LKKLVSAYQSFDEEFLVLRNGKKFALSDHRTDKSFEEMLEHPDIDDMFYVPYPRGTIPKQPAKNFDPGRGHSRCASWCCDCAQAFLNGAIKA
jgi:hypothetical protein